MRTRLSVIPSACLRSSGTDKCVIAAGALASVSVPAYYMPLRLAGAQARKVLVDAVAAEWKVPAGELTTGR